MEAAVSLTNSVQRPTKSTKCPTWSCSSWSIWGIWGIWLWTRCLRIRESALLIGAGVAVLGLFGLGYKYLRKPEKVFRVGVVSQLLVHPLKSGKAVSVALAECHHIGLKFGDLQDRWVLRRPAENMQKNMHKHMQQHAEKHAQTCTKSTTFTQVLHTLEVLLQVVILYTFIGNYCTFYCTII